MSDDELLLYIGPALGVLMGVLWGYMLGHRAARREHVAYKQGQALEHERALKREAKSGGPCWVRNQLPLGTEKIDEA